MWLPHPQGVSLQDLLTKLGRPFKEYELWALSHACLSTLRTLGQHPGDPPLRVLPQHVWPGTWGLSGLPCPCAVCTAWGRAAVSTV